MTEWVVIGLLAVFVAIMGLIGYFIFRDFDGDADK